MKLNHLKIVLICLLGLTTLKAEIAFTELKDLYNALTPERSYLSPVHGFTWWKRSIIENMYRFGPKDHAVIQLIRELFYLQHDEVTFDITTLNRNPAKYISMQTVGKLLDSCELITKKYLDNETIKPEEYVTLKAKLVEVLDSAINTDEIINQSAHAMAQASAELKKVTEQRKKLTNQKPRLNQLIQRLKQRDSKSEPQEASSSQQTELNQKMQELAALEAQLTPILEQEKQIERTIKNAKVDKATFINQKETLANAMVGALQQSFSNEYPPFTMHEIMLAFLWQRASTKDEFKNYFDAFATSPLKADANWSEIVKSKYTEKDFIKYLGETDKLPKTSTDPWYEIATFAAYGLIFYESKYPPVISSTNANYTLPDTKQKVSFPDCVETACRNICNRLLFDNSSNTFSPQLYASNEKIKLDQLLDSYYKTNSDTSRISTPQYHDDWTAVVENRAGIRYGNRTYELEPSVSTFLKLFNYLFLGNNQELAQKSNSEQLDYLCSALSRENLTLLWKSEAINNAKTSAEITFFFNDVPLVLHITPDHSYVTTAPQARQKTAWDESLKSLFTTNTIQAAQIINLFVWQENVPFFNFQDSLRSFIDVLPNQYLLLYYYKYNLANTDIRDQNLSALIKKMRPENNQTLKETLKTGIESLPSNDGHYLMHKMSLAIQMKLDEAYIKSLFEIGLRTGTNVDKFILVSREFTAKVLQEGNMSKDNILSLFGNNLRDLPLLLPAIIQALKNGKITDSWPLTTIIKMFCNTSFSTTFLTPLTKKEDILRFREIEQERDPVKAANICLDLESDLIVAAASYNMVTSFKYLQSSPFYENLSALNEFFKTIRPRIEAITSPEAQKMINDLINEKHLEIPALQGITWKESARTKESKFWEEVYQEVRTMLPSHYNYSVDRNRTQINIKKTR